MQKALAPEISTWPDDNPQLIGSGAATAAPPPFPCSSAARDAARATMTELLLPRRGTLVAWTTQGFPPGAALRRARPARTSCRSGWAWSSSVT